MYNILIADDNNQIVSILSDYAKKEGFNVYTAYDGNEAIDLFSSTDFEIILLDVMMPKQDGFEVCKHIRKKSNVPIIMITARGEDFEKIMGLDIGADDYIVKPFSPKEVMARVRAILRRIEKTDLNKKSLTTFEYDNLVINLDKYVASINSEVLSLTKKEIELLWLFATNKNKVYTRENLLDNIWGYDYLGDNRTVDSHIKRLRSKINKHSHPNWDVITVWGLGYKFEVKSNDK